LPEDDQRSVGLMFRRVAWQGAAVLAGIIRLFAPPVAVGPVSG
jgi:hypothetical protein